MWMNAFYIIDHNVYSIHIPFSIDLIRDKHQFYY